MKTTRNRLCALTQFTTQATRTTIKAAAVCLTVFLSINIGFGQSAPIYNQIGEWCDVYTQTNPGPGSQECIGCLNHPNQRMQNASSSKTKNRVLYVNDFALFKNNTKGQEIDPFTNKDEYYLKTDESILGDMYKEKELLDYACFAGFDELILYNVTTILARADGYFDDDPNNLTWPQELARFMVAAQQLYGLEIGINAPESGSSFSNISDFYDLTAIGNGRMNYLNAFQQNGFSNCINWKITPGGSGPKGYFELSDINLAYPLDSRGRAHPFDAAALDILNIGRFKYEFENGILDQTWWTGIYNKLSSPNENPWWNPNGGLTGCFEGLNNTVFLQSSICHSYSKIVTEYEFWIDETQVLSSTSSDVVYDIEAAFVEQYILLDYINCININLADHWAETGVSCPVNSEAYIIQLSSSQRFANGQLGSSSGSPRKHYVLGGSWVSPYNQITTYDYDKASQQIAKAIDKRADRIYLATYRKTPCHLWSDDVVNNNQSYGRRFKDVYAYFSDNGQGSVNANQTEIYPLFSSRHYSFDIDFKPAFPETYRRHLGLYLSNSGVYANANGFTGSLGGAEHIFDQFANDGTTGCSTQNVNNSYPSPYLTLIATTVPSTTVSGSTFTGTQNTISGFQENKVYTIGTGNSTDQYTIRESSLNGPIVAHDKGATIKFKPRNNGVYVIQLNRELNGVTCDYHNNQNYPRTLSVTLESLGVLENQDANPYGVNYYDNVINGYAWYRWTDLGGKWNPSVSVASWQFFKTGLVNATSDGVAKYRTMKVYPVPSKNNLYVEYEGPFELSIFTINGHLIKTLKSINKAEIQNLEKGLYILQVPTEDGVRTRKVSVL